MNTNNNYTGFEKLLQDKFSSFELPYEHKDWLDFEKKMPKSSNFFHSNPNIFKYLSFASVFIVIISILAIFYVKSDNNENFCSNKQKNNIVNNTKTNNNVNKENLISHNYDNKNNIKSTDSKIDNINTASGNTNTSNTSFINVNNNNNNNIAKNLNTITPLSQNNNTNSFNNIDNSKKLFDGNIISSDIVEGCVPLKVLFKSITSSDTVSYLWEFGDGKTSVLANPSHTYNKAGIYSVKLTLKLFKSSTTKKITYSRNINVKNTPVAQFDYSLDSENDIISFSDNSLNSQSSLWLFGDKSSSNEKYAQHEYQQNGTYKVELISINTNGCTDTATKKIVVKLKDQYFVPNAFTPNGDGTNDSFGPIGDNLVSDGYKMSIFDKNGILIFESNNLDTYWEGKISATNTYAKPDMYFWKIKMKDKYGNIRERSGYVNLLKVD